MTRNSSTPAAPARIHLLAARLAPVVIVIRRKPSRLVHILKWNTETDEIESGSWFNGRLYEMRSDVSADGVYMIYLAMGFAGNTWTGVCRPPFLRTILDWPNEGSWHGGGVFQASGKLEINAGLAEPAALAAIQKHRNELPFEIGFLDNSGYGEDEGVLFPRFERDSFRRAGPHGRETTIPGTGYRTACENDPGWIYRPSQAHPELRVRYRGYSSGRGRIFEWDLPELPGLLDERVSWAAFDALGQLVCARSGVLYRYRLDDLIARRPTATIDLELLQPPPPKKRDTV